MQQEMIMKQNIILLLLFMFRSAFKLKVLKLAKTDKFTKDKVVYTSYEKISSEAFIGTQTGKKYCNVFLVVKMA